MRWALVGRWASGPMGRWADGPAGAPRSVETRAEIGRVPARDRSVGRVVSLLRGQRMKVESTGSAVGTTGAEGAASTALIGLTCGAVSVVAGLLQIIDTYYAAHPPIWLVLLAILAWMTWVAMMSRQLVQLARGRASR